MITGVVLAAGTSSRFGRTKQLELVGAKPLVQHAVDALAGAGLDEIILVLGHDAERAREVVRFPATARWVLNLAYSSGMAGSLATGLRAADPGSEAAVVLLADQPGVTAQHVRSLVEAFAARHAPIVRLSFRSGPGPALLSREVWAEAEELEGDVGARILMERHPELVEDVIVGGDAPRDVDTPEDLERVREGHRY